MKKQLFVLVTVFLFSALFPAGALPGSRQIVFFDDFSNNVNAWAVENSASATFEFRDGFYYL